MVITLALALAGCNDRISSSDRPTTKPHTTKARHVKLDPRLLRAAEVGDALNRAIKAIGRTATCLEAGGTTATCGSERQELRRIKVLKAQLDDLCLALADKYGTMYTGPCAY